MRLETLAVAAVVVVLSACSRASAKPLPIVPAPVPTDAHEVVITDYKFFPQTLTVPVGTTVRWINHDNAPHTATHRSFSGEAFDSGDLGNHGGFAHTFKTPGSYPYLCMLHQGMVGTIVVQ